MPANSSLIFSALGGGGGTQQRLGPQTPVLVMREVVLVVEQEVAAQRSYWSRVDQSGAGSHVVSDAPQLLVCDWLFIRSGSCAEFDRPGQQLQRV